VLDVRTNTTDELDESALADIRTLMDVAFGERFDDHDWDHTVGGHHVQGFDAGTLIAHASVVPRTLWCGDLPLRAGYVEGVAVHPDRQREGHGTAVMNVIAQLIGHHYELGALSAGDVAQLLYRKLGWVVWAGPSYVQTVSGREATPEEDGYILVLPRPGLELTAPIACEWRPGDVW
jgi:aminoglycoside 2'-N-acetyltransferase I